ncbi:MAG: hypothetical protein PHD72_01615 [Patescibacteria group bacterium]|nr:hypothetical protein [Patescibacteria group bacterium]
MIAHRLQTRLPAEPSVRVYRTIALSFLFITVVLLGVVIFTMFKKTEITIIAKEDAETVNIIITAEARKNGEKSLPALVTTTKFYWTEKYFPTGTKLVEGVAKGELVIYNTTNESQTLVKTTRFLTPEGVLFRLSDRVIIPANGQITAAVYADQSGLGGDIGPSKFTIPGLNTEKQKVIYAESTKPMSGGSGKVGAVTENDIKSAQTDFSEKIKQAYLSAFPVAGSQYDQVIIGVGDTGIAPSHEVGDEVAEFSLSGTSTLTLIRYNKKDLADIINKEIAGSVDAASEKILSVGDNPKITLAATDFTNQSAQLAVAAEAFVTLAPDAPLLNKENFLNKEKGEIERYIVSLPHVTGMNIKFTPSWVSKAPGVPDKLKIIVRSEK